MVERLRDAIAKARASREGRAALVEPGARGPGRAAISAEPALTMRAGPVGARWQALASWQGSPREMDAARLVARIPRPEATPFDVMRTKILQQMRANRWRRLAITSPSAGCGKSTVALNLAFSLARQEEYYTVLIETDLRRPAIAKMLELEGEAQVSEVLAGRAELQDHALRYGSNLAIATNKRPAANPAELIHSESTPRALDRIQALYEPDLMIFDTAPVLVSDDTLALAAHVDCVLIIAATEETSIKEIDICERELAERTNVMGVVVNKFRYAGPEYGYSYGYGYGPEGA